MDKVRQSAPQLANIEPYDPKYIPAKIMNSANENPLDVPAHIKNEMLQALQYLPFNRYPDPLANDLRDMIATHESESLAQGCAPSPDKSKPQAQDFDLTRDNVIVGNGGDELLFNIALIWGGVGRTFLNVPPTFSVYENNALLTQTNIVNIPRNPDFSLNEDAILNRAAKDDIDYIILTSPNNPTGDLVRPQFIEKLLNVTDALVVVDEAYFEFSGKSVLPLLSSNKNLMILRTFSKAYSLAGVRVGYALAHSDVIREFLRVRQPYSVNAMSQCVAKVAYAHRDEMLAGVQTIVQERQRMFDALQGILSRFNALNVTSHLGADLNMSANSNSEANLNSSTNLNSNAVACEVFPSSANYLLCRLPHADKVWQQLLDAGILVRDFSHSKGLENCLRISIGTHEENDAFLQELQKILGLV